MKNYPKIAELCLMITVDNGGIYIGRSVDQQNEEFEHWLANEGYSIVDLDATEAWLATKTHEELDLIASGGQDEPETVAALAGAPLRFEEFITLYFDEVC